MIESAVLQVFATVALGLAGVSGLVLLLAKNSVRHLNSLYRARVTVLFQLTLTTLFLSVLPMTIRASEVADHDNLRASSLTMTAVLALAMLLTRRTYAKSRIEYPDQITTAKQLLFFGLMSTQLALSATVATGLSGPIGWVIYPIGLAVLIGLAFHQLIRFVSFQNAD